MRAREIGLQQLNKPKKALSDKARQRLINRAHEQALKMNAAIDARMAMPPRVKFVSAAQRACQKKRAYATAQAAAQACAVSRSKIADGYFPVRVYQCDQCGKWHLTSKALGIQNELSMHREEKR